MVEGRSHARMGTFEVPSAALDEVVALFRDRVVPAFSRHDGFSAIPAGGRMRIARRKPCGCMNGSHRDAAEL